MKGPNFYPALLTLLQVSPNAKDPQRAVVLRLKHLGYACPCSRCGGSGNYSFNGSDSICYKCRGARFFMPELTVAQYHEVAEKAEAGLIDEYLEALRTDSSREKAARTALDRVMKAWKDTGVTNKYHWQLAATNETHKAVSNINALMCAEYQTLQELVLPVMERAKNAKAPKTLEAKEAQQAYYKAKFQEIAERTEHALAVIAEAAKGLEQYPDLPRAESWRDRLAAKN